MPGHRRSRLGGPNKSWTSSSSWSYPLPIEASLSSNWGLNTSLGWWTAAPVTSRNNPDTVVPETTRKCQSDHWSGRFGWDGGGGVGQFLRVFIIARTRQRTETDRSGPTMVPPRGMPFTLSSPAINMIVILTHGQKYKCQHHPYHHQHHNCDIGPEAKISL